MTAMAGPTSATDTDTDTDVGLTPVHSCDLVEDHTVLIELGDRDAPDALTDCQVVIHDWCEAHGVEPMAFHEVNRFDSDKTLIGYGFTVTVGRGQLSLDQSAAEPGEDDDWTFSARVGHWWRLFNTIRNTPLVHTHAKRHHLATVTPIKRSGPEVPPLPVTCRTEEPWTDPWPDT